MRLIKLAGLNIDVAVGQMEGNYKTLLCAAREAAEGGATIVAGPEMVLCGYPAEDLVQWRGFVDQQWQYAKRFAKETEKLESVFVFGLAVFYEDAVYNCAIVICKGRILGVVPKEKLPTYNVFYDMRTFSRGGAGMRGTVEGIPFGDMIFSFPFGKLAVEVCEDIWSSDGPMERRVNAGAEVVVNISASPWRAGVMGTRREMLATRSSDNHATLLYVNMVGGMDALVFDGGGFVFQNGQKLLEVPFGKRFRSGIFSQVVDVDRTRLSRSVNTTRRMDAEMYRTSNLPMPIVIECDGPTQNHTSFSAALPKNKSFLIPENETQASTRDEYFDELIEAMVLGFGGYFEKTGVFENALIALSGGRDSALTLLLVHLYATRRFEELSDEARRAAVQKFIRCVSMPSRFNSHVTKSIAHDLCTELGVTFEERSIEEAFQRELTELREQLGKEPNGIAVQNIMPRIRMTRMQNLSNANRSLLLHCGNMTEKAMGYGTIGGDFTAGAYSLLGNLPKTVVRALIQHLRDTKYPLPSLDALIASEESAELALDQRDEDDLGLLEVLDACIHLFYFEKRMPHEVYQIVRQMWTDDELTARYPGYKKGMLKSWVKRFVRSTYNATFKWVVSPLAVHLGSLDLDRERALQIPVVKSMQWLEESLREIDSFPEE